MPIVAGLEVSHDRATRIYRWGFGIRRSMSARKRRGATGLEQALGEVQASRLCGVLPARGRRGLTK